MQSHSLKLINLLLMLRSVVLIFYARNAVLYPLRTWVPGFDNPGYCFPCSREIRDFNQDGCGEAKKTGIKGLLFIYKYIIVCLNYCP